MTARKARKHPGITQTASSTPPSAYRNQRAPAPLSVIPEGNLLLPLQLPLPLPFCLSFPKGICFCPRSCRCPCLSVCHSRRESSFALAAAVAPAFLSVIPEGNLLLHSQLPLPLPFCLSFPKGICCCLCRCPCLSVCHSRRESAVAFAVAVALAFLSVIPGGNLLLPLQLPLPLPFCLSFPKGICCCRGVPRTQFCRQPPLPHRQGTRQSALNSKSKAAILA